MEKNNQPSQAETDWHIGKNPNKNQKTKFYFPVNMNSNLISLFLYKKLFQSNSNN